MLKSHSSGESIPASTPLSRRRSRSIPAKRSRHGSIRIGFFVATALWGFVLGAGFLALALSLSNVRIPRDGAAIGLLAAGALFAAVGGVLGAKSYRESVNR